ncbi:MAG: MFS transporter [Clostridia bacterium]|nr:MFS transporter [Clostridia bacterium]
MNFKKVFSGAKGSEGGVYRTASMRSMLMGCATSGGKTVFMMLMSYAGYMANEGYGVLVMVTGIIMTIKTIFDGVCDPIVAAVFDRMKVGKLGKVRKFLLIGYGATVLSAILMFHILANRFDGALGVFMFCLHFALYIIGYTILSIGTTTIPAILTNDPKQRPFLNFTATVYQFSAPIILNAIMAFAILPRHGNQYNAACLGEACYVYSAVALLFMTISLIGIAPVDNDKVLGELMSMGKKTKVGFKDMVNMIKVNKPLRCYIVTGASDKLATKMSTDSIVNVMLTGILIANYQAVTVINSFSKVIALVFAFLGGVFIAKYGVKKSTTVWSWVNIGISVSLFALCMILGPWGMRQIGIGGFPMILYIALMMGKDAAAMVLNTAEGMMRADIVDYELDRSGNFMPGMVGACYTFIEKLISSLGSTFTTLAVGMIGYVTVMPQMGDRTTIPLFYLTMILVYGMPVLGWMCNIVAMKFYSLDKERMVEIQTSIAEKKKLLHAKKA